MSLLDNICPFGCSTLDIEDKCANCGHMKKQHSIVHPHICLGPLNADEQTTKESCMCSEYTTQQLTKEK